MLIDYIVMIILKIQFILRKWYGIAFNLYMDIDKYGLPVAVASYATISFVTEVTCFYPMIGFIKSKENFIKSKI